MAKVSVIIPVYKVEEYVSRCVESVLCQHFSNVEIILVDDGSPDNSGTLCDDFAYQIKNIPVYVVHQLNGGLSAARNAGINWAMACSDSEWLCFIDSDDTVSPLFIEKLYAAAVDHDADLAVCDFREVDTDGKDIHQPHAFPAGLMADHQAQFEAMYQTWRVHPAWNKLYKKELFRDLRFDVGRLHEDEFIIHKVLFLSNRVVFLPELLYDYRIRSSGIMGTEDRKTRADLHIAEINRYWFCKEHGLPVEPRILGIDYMTIIREFDDDNVTRQYQKIYFDFVPNRSVRKRLSYYFFPVYRCYRKWRLKK